MRKLELIDKRVWEPVFEEAMVSAGAWLEYPSRCNAMYQNKTTRRKKRSIDQYYQSTG